MRRSGRFAPLLALTPLLGGCVFAAVPLVAGGLAVRDEMSRPKPPDTEISQSDRVPAFPTEPVSSDGADSDSASAPAQTLAAAPKTTPPAATPSRTDQKNPAAVANSVPPTRWVTTPLMALPAPASPVRPVDPGSMDADITSWAAFARYAVTRAPPPLPGEARRSAVIDQTTVIDMPRREQCGAQPTAVVIDLDPGQEPIDLDDPPTSAPGLTEALARIREAGVAVLWLTEHPASDEDRIRRLLGALELDDGGSDPLLLRNPGERKQTVRIAAARKWCILAIAGDRRGDFDELFDYLLDSAGPTASGLETLFGDGWFLAPVPIS